MKIKSTAPKAALSALLLLAGSLAHATPADSVESNYLCESFPTCEPPVAPEPPAERSKGKKQG